MTKKFRIPHRRIFITTVATVSFISASGGLLVAFLALALGSGEVSQFGWSVSGWGWVGVGVTILLFVAWAMFEGTHRYRSLFRAFQLPHVLPAQATRNAPDSAAALNPETRMSRVALETEQEVLLLKFVEAHRSVPSEARGPFS